MLSGETEIERERKVFSIWEFVGWMDGRIKVQLKDTEWNGMTSKEVINSKRYTAKKRRSGRREDEDQD